MNQTFYSNQLCQNSLNTVRILIELLFCFVPKVYGPETDHGEQKLVFIVVIGSEGKIRYISDTKSQSSIDSSMTTMNTYISTNIASNEHRSSSENGKLN